MKYLFIMRGGIRQYIIDYDILSYNSQFIWGLNSLDDVNIDISFKTGPCCYFKFCFCF